MTCKRYITAACLLALMGSLHGQMKPVAAGRIMVANGPVAPGGGGRAASDKTGLHIPQGRNVNFTYTLTDGGGYRWDIQYYGTIGQGTNYAFSGGLYLQINGSSVHSSGRGWINEAGDEVEIGPYSRSNVNIYRRIKIYKDRGLARWLDIFENPTGSEITLNVRVYSCTNYSIQQTATSTGGAQFGEKDFAFVTKTQGNNSPAVMYYVCGERSKVRPTVNTQSNQVYVNYRVKIPANGTSVLCYFVSQNNSMEELKGLMKSLRPYKALRDLPASVRKLLVNMPVGSGLGNVELNRIESADTVITAKGDPLFGTIKNKAFPLKTLFGPMDLPAEKVVGMAMAPGEKRQFRVLLTGGQVIAGALPADEKLNLAITTGGELKVPFKDIQQTSFRISKQRPDEAPFAAPMMFLRTGDQVLFDGGQLALRLTTRHGTVPLRAGDLLSITMDNPGNGLHRVSFINGSQLAGLIEPATIPLKLALGPKLDVPRNLIAEAHFAEEDKPNDRLDGVKLTNGDVLFGKLMTKKITIRTEYGPVALTPETIKSISFSRSHLGRASVVTWDGTSPRGQITPEVLTFKIEPGPTIELYAGQCEQIIRTQTDPPNFVLEKVQKLIAQLGAESYKDRQAASDALVELGKGIVPLLRKHLNDSDPEVRQRLQDVIEKLGGKAVVPDDNNGNDPFPPGIFWGAQRMVG